VRVKLVKADMESNKIDFVLVQAEKGVAGKRAGERAMPAKSGALKVPSAPRKSASLKHSPSKPAGTKASAGKGGASRVTAKKPAAKKPAGKKSGSKR
jgi:ribonuclease R